MKFGIAIYSNSSKIDIIYPLAHKVKSFMETRDYGAGIQDYVIGVICMSPEFDSNWKGDRKKYWKSKKLLEYDIKLNYAQIENATEKEIEKMFARSWLNSLGVIEELKIKNFAADKFREDLIQFFEQNGIEWDKEPAPVLLPSSSDIREREPMAVGADLDVLYDIRLMTYGFKSLGEAHFVEEFFQMLENANPAYLPDKIGVNEPLKIPFSLESAKKVWLESARVNGFSNNVMFEGPKCRGNIIWRQDDLNLNFIELTMSRHLVFLDDGIERLINLGKELFLWSNGVYGFSCFGIDTLSNLLVLDFKICLGGISWLTLFGPPYTEMFGKDVIQTAPCKAEEFSENHFMLLTSEVPIPIKPELLKKQSKVKKHLGADAFCGKNPPRTMEDIVTFKNKFRSPDFSTYYRGTN